MRNLRTPLALALGWLALCFVFLSGAFRCSGAPLTTAEAEQALDVACGALIQAVATQKSRTPTAILQRICDGRQTRALIEQIIELTPPSVMERDPFPYPDGGSLP